jgi:hypothetical protein
MRELERLPLRKTMEVEILKEALGLIRAKTLSRSPAPGDVRSNGVNSSGIAERKAMVDRQHDLPITST